MDADILLTCHPTISYAAVLNKHKFKGRVVVTEHSACDFYSKKRLYCNAAVFRFADQFVVLTENDRAIYQRLGCSSTVIPNANFKCMEGRAKLKEKVILAAGRIEPVKGFDRLISAFSIISAQYPDGKLCICGDGTMENDLKHQVETMGLSEKVVFPGRVTNMQDYFNKASIFALSSTSEGFSLVLVEAMSFGLPVVSFDLPAAREILCEGGGVLATQGDIYGFADRLGIFMTDVDLRERIGNEAFASAPKYTIPVVSEHWIRLFKSLMER